jgi:hypothetical protein
LMTDTYRALCKELVDELEDWIYCDDESEIADTHSLINRARAALAQPEPVAPSNEALIQLAIDTRLYRFQATAGDPVQYEMTEQQVHAFARAVLARWGTPAINTREAEGPKPEEILAFCARYDGPTPGLPAALRDFFASWGTPANEPVPVSERRPGPEDCDAEGRCWMFDPCDRGWWAYRSALPSDEELGQPPWTHWLPHWALPVPAGEGAS